MDKHTTDDDQKKMDETLENEELKKEPEAAGAEEVSEDPAKEPKAQEEKENPEEGSPEEGSPEEGTPKEENLEEGTLTQGIEKNAAEGSNEGQDEAETEETAAEDEDLTEPAPKTIEVDEEEMLFTRRKLKNLEEESRKLNNELDTLKERMMRLTAEYENYRNRTTKEKEEIATDSTCKVLADILPVMDNLERALIAETDDLPGLKDGVQLTLDQFVIAMQKMGVELINTEEGFDPELHDAVMHELDETRGEKEITEVFLKGYKKGDKVVRHSVVKVVN